MSDVALRLLVLQFLVAATFWIGSAPLDRFRWRRGPEWTRIELTRLVLPLLMVSAGLLFFSTPLAPAWQSALYLEGFQGVPATWSRWAFLLLNFGVVAVVLASTGGAKRSPFLPLLAAIPLFVWAVGVPTPEVTGAGILAVVVFVGARDSAAVVRAPEPAGTRAEAIRSRGLSRWLTLLTSFLTLAATLWMGGRLGV